MQGTTILAYLGRKERLEAVSNIGCLWVTFFQIQTFTEEELDRFPGSLLGEVCHKWIELLGTRIIRIGKGKEERSWTKTYNWEWVSFSLDIERNVYDGKWEKVVSEHRFNFVSVDPISTKIKEVINI